MKKICFLILIFGGFVLPVSAAHIRGGELYYKYSGPGAAANSSKYLVTLKLYIDCGQNDPGQLDTRVFLTVFSKPNNTQVLGTFANMSNEEFIRYDPASNPCLNNPPRDVCYRLRYYQTTIELPNTASGYTIAFQRCCRIEGIQNLVPPSNDFGATYSCEIPGTALGVNAYQNTSPSVTTKDAVAVCVGSDFQFDFSAKDEQNDSLVYKFCDAYAGGGPNNGQNCYTCPLPIPGAPPPYRALNYQSPYSGSAPMGGVTINSKTGIMSGIAPNKIGQYVVTVCIAEYRKGVLINTHRKDIHIKVSDCIPLNAVLKPDYSYCDDFLVTFRNLQVNPTGSVYTWDFGDGSTPESTTVPDGTLQHLYADTGTYRVKLKVVLAGQCLDSTTTLARVYPGFFPGFTFNGACLYTPFEFNDTTKGKYGPASKWTWNFGDETTDGDTSHARNTTWKYNSLGFKTVQLIVGSTKGCIDTVPMIIEVKDKPDLTLPFTDTLICDIDTLQLRAIGDGTFKWSPTDSMLNSTSATPIVFPDKTTTYNVTMTENRCVANGSIRVRVVSFVTLNAGSDTTICTTDTIQLNPQGDGLKYTWTATPSAYINDANTRMPLTTPLTNTNYHVISRIGKCFAEDDLNVVTIPYPEVDAGRDAIICYDDTVMLNGYTNGSSFRWDPPISIINRNTLAPSVFPLQTRTYTLLGYDTLGCPKPGIDRVVVSVRPEIVADAGNDTAIVKGQPLQLKGSGSEFFAWSPETGLNTTSKEDPIAVVDRNMSYVLKAYDANGCYDLDTMNVQVFQTAPDIFVPNAFAPDGRNRELRPKAVGISTLQYFRVFNRWGQIVFQTTQFDKGWDGTVNGVRQANGTYVWMVRGTDYTGKIVTRKGTAVLIR
ncbi:MAG: gliding motility-associated C-terminal domain-containing protein [Chitinophagaceae bacterium]|nr:gliding motility-associated C-terminal domain-containing protein [Chitinophagaceae bacterium]